jgi:uronate dehydrogenase
MTKRKVLVTGAAGLIAGQVLPALRERYELTLLDVRNTDRNGNLIADIQAAFCQKYSVAYTPPL